MFVLAWATICRELLSAEQLDSASFQLSYDMHWCFYQAGHTLPAKVVASLLDLSYN